MSYQKAMKHFKNHRKDRFCQPCSFSFDTPEKSLAAIAEETAESYYVGELMTRKQISPNFSTPDEACDFLFSIPPIQQFRYGVFTDKGFILMK